MTFVGSLVQVPVEGSPSIAARADVPILVVDDNSAKRLALRAVLSPLGYRIVEANSGVAALRCLMVEDFAAILLDVRMPIMSGFETAALIRQRQQSEMTPIIFITAYRNDEVVDINRFAEGAADFMFAPVPPDELRSKVSVFANLFIKARGLAARAREVQESADGLRLLTDAAPIGIFQTDSEDNYVYTNPRWAEITGIPSPVAVGKSWDFIIEADQRDALAATSDSDAALRGELCHRFEIRCPTATRIVLLTSKAIPDGTGGAAGRVGTLADVTSEATAEAAMSDARDKATEASRLKSDFLANMSHQIRTQMNGVIGMTDLLLETDLDSLQREYAQTARNSGEALLPIIEDILDFSKGDAGKLDIEDIEYSPATIVDARSPLAALVEAESLSPQPGRGRVLLAEDNLINQRVTVAMLSGAGYLVDTVANGTAALQAASSHPYDLILMDCQMPEMSGYEATAAIRASEGSWRHTPIIALTAGARREDRDRCLSEGMDGYLAKPVSKDALLGLVARFVNNAAVSAAAPLTLLQPAVAVVENNFADASTAQARPMLDLQVINDLERLAESAGEGFLKSLAANFLAEADARVTSLRAALASEDAESVARSAHTLGGSSANLGATDLARICATLATDAGSGDLASGAALFHAIDVELARIRPAMSSLACR